MPHSDLIRKYFSAYENKDRKAVESLLTDDFVFTSPYDHHIDRAIEALLEKGNGAFILYDGETKDGGSSRNTEFFTINDGKVKEIEVFFGSPPKDASKI